MSSPAKVISRLSTVERHGWTYDTPIGGASTTAGRRTTWRVCPAVIVPNLNAPAGTSPRPPQTPVTPGPLHVDQEPVHLSCSDGQWLATGRFTHPAVLDPSFEATLDPGTSYLLSLDEHDVVVTTAQA